MIRSLRGATLGLFALVFTSGHYAHAQANPTASQSYQLSVFGGGTGNFTGFIGGKNLDITAGADLGFRSFFHVNPSIEVRGTYPVEKGTLSSQKNILVGLKAEKRYGAFHPYADFLVGRGAMDFPRSYQGSNGLFYIRTTSAVFSPGVGIDADLTSHLAVKADFQIQRYSTPVTVSGTVYSKATTFGVVYRFDFNHHRHQRY